MMHTHGYMGSDQILLILVLGKNAGYQKWHMSDLRSRLSYEIQLEIGFDLFNFTTLYVFFFKLFVFLRSSNDVSHFVLKSL